jgi:hypothetical protein
LLRTNPLKRGGKYTFLFCLDINKM